MIGMRLSMGYAQTLKVEQKLEQTLKQELKMAQKVKIDEHIFFLHLQLIESLREEKYEPQAQCPNCGHRLTNMEILSGFNRSPTDYTTKCPGCEFRFEPKLIFKNNVTRVELPFYCNCQALYKLINIGIKTPEELSRSHPAVYRTCIVHHGTIKNAYSAIGLDFPYEEISGWISKVTPFLGRMKDTQIARCANVSDYQVRKLRKQMNIPCYKVEKTLEEINEHKIE